MVAAFIGRACWEIFSDTSRTLGDRIAIAEAEVREVVCGVPGVLGCHHIRSRGSADHVFLDLHVWLAPEMPLMDAHALSHVVKDRVMDRFPQIKDAVIHIEPPPPASVSEPPAELARLRRQPLSGVFGVAVAGFDSGSPVLPTITTEITAGSVALALAEVLCTDPSGSKNDCPAVSVLAGSPSIAHLMLPRTT